MRVVYCDHCKDISIKARLEKETCTTCGRVARRIPYSRPWQYYASTGTLVSATAVLVLVPIPDLLIRLTILGLALAITLVFASWSIAAIRAKILRTVKEAEQREAGS